MTPLTGGCSCGAVRYELTSAPMFVHCCHCLLCQRQTGSAFVINGLIETSRIRCSSTLSAISMPTESGRPHDIYRCPSCLVAVWSDYGRRPALRFVRLATLDAPHTFAPDVHIYTRSKVPWVRLPEGARAFSEYYDMPTEWPQESLARRRAILGDG
ncbi:MAG: GFA family protein [Myxococcota bacterium]